MPFPLPASSRFLPIPDELRPALAPAQLALFEWTDYFFHWPGADALQVGPRTIEPVAPGTFRVRWENALGLAKLQPVRAGAPLEAPWWVEVLSPKFPTPALHLSFLRALLAGLFARSSHLIWHETGETRRGAQTVPSAPAPMEALEWALKNGAPLEQVLAAIARHPARVWAGESVEVSPDAVWDLNADHLSALAQGARWQSVKRGAIVRGWAPQSVPQTRRALSFDCPDNRGALAFVGEISTALRAAKTSAWWSALDEAKREAVERLSQTLDGFGAGWREGCGPAREMWQPRGAPYRALWELQQSWGGAGAPLWAGAQKFAGARDVASLWEFAVFFILISSIEAARGRAAQLEATWDAARGMLAPARARWHDAGAQWSLVFNGPAPSYSTPLRPDYLWSKNGRALAAFDAKFRVEVPGGGGRGADLHKMHAYRDALGVRAAVALHPGAQTTFFDRERGPLGQVPLRAVLEGAAAGVGLWGVGAGENGTLTI